MKPKTMQDVVDMLLDEGFETTADRVRLARGTCSLCHASNVPVIIFGYRLYTRWSDAYRICADRPACHAREAENERELLDAVVLCGEDDS